MKITLVGYMGSGKSLIGKLLSNKLEIPFIDLDAYIESKEQLSINDLFNNKGEIYFRIKEGEYLKEILNSEESFVLALGGGTPCYGSNNEVINMYTHSIYLQTSIPTLVNRLTNETSERPLIKSLAREELTEFIGKHLFERRAFYEKAHVTIYTDDKSIDTILEEITATLA